MREFISWELWNSFPCNLLIAVLSEKLTLNIINFVSDPKWLVKTIHSLLSQTDSVTLKPTEVKQELPLVQVTENTASIPEIPKLELNLIHHERPAEVIYLPGVDTVDTKQPTIDVVDTDNLLQEPLAESESKIMPLVSF